MFERIRQWLKATPSPPPPDNQWTEEDVVDRLNELERLMFIIRERKPRTGQRYVMNTYHLTEEKTVSKSMLWYWH